MTYETPNANPLPLLIIDGNNLLWRAAHGAQYAPVTQGKNLAACHGFFALIAKALREDIMEPVEIIVVFDSRAGSEQRKEMYADYKGTRNDRAAAFNPFECLPEIEQTLTNAGISWVRSQDAEADDVIATLARSQNRLSIILSADKDFFQLCNGQTIILNSTRASGQRIIQSPEIFDKYGVKPHQWVDFRALSGDSSDNIPGIKGLGPKTAAKLLSGDKKLEDLQGTDIGKFTAELEQQWEQVLIWKQMMTLQCDVIIDVVPTGKETKVPNRSQINHLLDL